MNRHQAYDIVESRLVKIRNNALAKWKAEKAAKNYKAAGHYHRQYEVFERCVNKCREMNASNYSIQAFHTWYRKEEAYWKGYAKRYQAWKAQFA